MSENQLNESGAVEAELFDDKGGNQGNNGKGMGHIERIIKVFTSPSEAFEEISARPKILVPALIIMVVMTLATYLSFDTMIELVRQQMINQAQMFGTEVPVDGFQSLARSSAYTSLVVVGITVVISAFFRALVTWVIGTFVSSEGSIKKLFSVALYAGMIVTLGSALALVIQSVAGLSNFSFSLAMFAGGLDAASPLYMILGTLNLFTIWYYIVLSIGVSKAEKISFLKSLLIVIIPSLIQIVITIVFSGMASSLLGM